MARPVRVMHFADTHFGVELYGRLDPDTGLNTRLKDFKRSLLKAVDLALEFDVDLAVFAGDADRVASVAVEQGDDLAVDRPAQHHLPREQAAMNDQFRRGAALVSRETSPGHDCDEAGRSFHGHFRM